MQNQLSQEEKAFFNKAKPEKNKIWARLLFCSILILFVGVLADALMGFPILKNSQSLFSGLGGILLLGVLYILGEGAGYWAGSKDDVSQPIGKRIINLFLLLLITGIFCVIFYYVFKLIT